MLNLYQFWEINLYRTDLKNSIFEVRSVYFSDWYNPVEGSAPVKRC